MTCLITNSVHPFIEENKTMMVSAYCVAALAIAGIGLGILAQANVIPLLHAHWIPFIAASVTVFTLDLAVLIGAVIHSRRGSASTQAPNHSAPLVDAFTTITLPPDHPCVQM